MERMKKTITQFQLLENGDKILVGLSGGPDSVALLHMLKKQEQIKIELFAVHVNHMCRPEASEETTHVRDLCKQMDIPVKIYYEDVPTYAKEHRMSFEQAGHVVRFRCFHEAAGIWNCNKLALGHHKDDRVESMLMHLIQGSGAQGLTAMSVKDGWIIRPLAEYSKPEILEYCRENHLHYDVDTTNLESECFRNQVRLELIPQLKIYNPQITEALLRTQEIIAEEDIYLGIEVRRLMEAYHTENGFPTEVFQKLQPAIQRRVLRQIWNDKMKSTADFSFAQMEQARYIANQADGCQTISLSHGMHFYRDYHMLGIRQAEVQGEYSYFWAGEEALKLPEYQATVCKRSDYDRDDSLWCIEVDAEKVQFPLVIRNRRPGDRLCISGMKGHKKLKDFFIDKKISRTERNRIPIICRENEILWIPGLFVSEQIKCNELTKNKIWLQCEKIIDIEKGF